jgi:hypothetical protein
VPLKKGKSKQSIEADIREEVKAGKPVDQAVAIAYRVAGHGNSKKGKRR